MRAFLLLLGCAFVTSSIVVSPSYLNWDSVSNVNSFTVMLSAAPVESVAVTITNEGDKYTALGACSLVFTTENWNVPQKVGMLARPNYISGIEKNFVITFDATTGDSASLAVSRHLPGASGQCSSWGDPHYTSFDGSKWNFFGVGDYYMVRSKDASLVVQTRQDVCGPRGVSCNFGALLKYKDEILAVGVDRNTGLPTFSKISGDDLKVVKVEVSSSGMTYNFKFPEGYVKVKIGYWSNQKTYYLNVIIVVPDRFKNPEHTSGLCLDAQGDTKLVKEENRVPYEESLFSGGTVPAMEAPPTIAADQDPDNFSDVQSCQVVEIPEVGSSWHSKKYTAHVSAESPAAYKRIWEELGDGNDGYCQKSVRTWNGISNRGLCGAKENWFVQMKSSFTVIGDQQGQWCFRLGADLGGGGTLMIDGAPVAYSINDLWWALNWNNHADVMQACSNLGAGEHEIEVYGWENCCDGAQRIEFKSPGQSWKVWSSDSLPIHIPTTVIEEENVGDVTELMNQVSKVSQKVNFGDPPEPPADHDEHDIDDQPLPVGAETLCSDFFSTSGAQGDVMTKVVALGIDLSDYISACEVDVKASSGDDEILQAVGAALLSEALKVSCEKDGAEQDYWTLQSLCDFCNGKGPCVDGKCQCEFPWQGSKCDHLIIEKPEVVSVHTKNDIFSVVGTGFFPEETHYCLFGTSKVEAKYVSRFQMLCEAPEGFDPKDGMAVTGDKDVAVDKFMGTTTETINDEGKVEVVVVTTGHKVADRTTASSVVYHTKTTVYVCSLTYHQVQCFGNAGTCDSKAVNWEYVGYSAPGEILPENEEVTINGASVSWNQHAGITIQPSADLSCTKPLESCRCI